MSAFDEDTADFDRDEPRRESFSLRQLTDPQVLTITGFPPYDGQWVRYEPPLVLPTEPTWGIAIVHEHKIAYAGKWTHRRDGDKNWLVDVLPGGIQTGAAGVKAFIPFTEEQIAQIEAAQS